MKTTGGMGVRERRLCGGAAGFSGMCATGGGGWPDAACLPGGGP
jgi:hypothetical protein